MAIVRLALANPAANTNSLLHTATRQSLVSVIATNTASVTAEVDVWVQPVGASVVSQYAYMAKSTVLPANNSLETFRFALENNDAIYIRSTTASVSFSLNAIHESSANYNKVTISATAPVGPTTGDVWINTTDNNTVNFWNGSAWIYSNYRGTTFYQTSAPLAPNTGDIWVDSDEVFPSINVNDFMPKSGGTFTGAVSGITPTVSTHLTTKSYVDGFMPLSGGTFTGTVAGVTPVSNNDLATKFYVDNNSSAIDPFLLGGM